MSPALVIDHQTAEVPNAHPVDRDGFRSFEVTELATGDNATPTGMKEELVLLSWLLVLMRTREGTLPRYEWAYKNRDEADLTSTHNQLPTEKLVPGLQSSTTEVAKSILEHIQSSAPAEGAVTSPASLLLSTGSLTPDAEANEEVSILNEFF